ncbi:hypothetical protein NQ314_013399 [Rhamnusium bicolor]|uniref:MRH domain-containing protein n=1 Tax=Rhamnusium bicolor TaxID=1586634 RepID=A0AAV8X7C9_9CUCU|nr:hypothetical protein NQ314_013399 [Rhamnusium bicolor]
MKETRLEIKNNCEYVVYIMSPQCEPKCTTRINEQLIDLRPLRGNFVVQSKERNFSITLCGSNPICKKFENGISFCETTNDSIIPLSKFQNEIMVYNKDKNAVTIRGFYKGLKKQDKRKVELIIKCNWNIDSSEITDKILPQQTKHYKFEMESSYGCIKLPQNCVITNIFFIYNLTNLYNRSGYLQVSNVPNGNIYLNICGPLQLKLSNPKNNCSNSFSQVCEVNNGNYINKGSILSKFEVVDDFIKTTFISGANCKDSDNRSRQHNTHVELSCSKTEEGPKFVRSEICDTFINWNTPLACPSYVSILLR